MSASRFLPAALGAIVLGLVSLLPAAPLFADAPAATSRYEAGIPAAAVDKTPIPFPGEGTFGQTVSGSYFAGFAPPGWQPGAGLVIWNHGFSLSPIAPLVDPDEEDFDFEDFGPLSPLHLSQGYAVAASSYSLPGWAVFQTVDDLEQMVARLESTYGDLGPIFLYGASLGGLVTVQALEEADLGDVVGALPVCGALAGSRAWDGGIDLRLAYDVVCGDAPGGAIAGGATGLPFPPDPGFDETALASAVNVCTGADLAESARTAEQQERLDQLLAVTGIPQNFLTTDMGFATFGLADLVFDPAKLAGGQAMDNAGVTYPDPEIEAEIQRVEADPDARARLVDHYTPSGHVDPAVKIVSLHTDKDGLVLLENETSYAGKIPAGQFSLGVVVEDVPSHCGFTEAEIVGAWEALRAWVAGGPQPGAATLQATCEAVANAGAADGPCRIDPDAELPAVSERLLPRGDCVEDATTLCLNDGRFRVQVEWTDFKGQSGDGMAVPQTGDTGAFWFFGEDNLELVVKVLDGRPINGKFWVFYGALSSVRYEITVTDTTTRKRAVYENPLGNLGSLADTAAF